ncbi:hypothetical protein [Sporolactobacillus terrae]|uniref:hypothetical protein n=1 Tax=Sporolactobacillus terrae TaxID=269673 RepID=UPI000A9773DF|nr:hypothetical protein [Sporolactobacillus terrae]
MIILVALCLVIFLLLVNGIMAIAALICGSILAKRKLKGENRNEGVGESECRRI